ncbi:uncharacterized protein DSM5745_05018 [Aspergillus mulundensis]|uniref:Uncharacterized protein n=1 Tax=Aspergillus mulundensis TaxID=1810919 RepID=A0A3D8S5X1_9EURO|nr:Uncharacterized protein DSM5745_05018 [Aspergillus mulundensis]RDW81461.1 Uncharacterized protein DSM5745_05018 [Aspergillus mulundensis]
MADVRSLLRNELASRRGTPQTGSNTPNRVTKKRKVDPADSATRKRVKQTDPDRLLAHAQIRPPSAQVAEDDDAYDVEPLPQDPDVMRTESDTATPTLPNISQETTAQPSEAPSITQSQAVAEPQPQNIDEDEWAAFEREVAAPTRVPQRPAAVAAAATISAAPITTEELAALQEREKETLRRNREAEAEGEREDAARFLEEEFDEMEQLEERVKRLKQMREQLRLKRTASAEMDEAATATEPVPNAADTSAPDKTDEDKEDDEEDDDDADDDWDNWRFR